jgi:hypothetical protein
MKIGDDENAGAGFLPAGGTFGGTQVHVSLLGSNGKYEKWQPLTGSFNSYGNLVNATISICQFDPGDDALPPADDTMCATASPMWADMGSVIGTDPTCTTDTVGGDPAHKDCGRISSCAGGPGCAETGATGNGVWVKSQFNLSAFAGRLARLRWIGSQGGGWSFALTRSALEPDPGNPTYQYHSDDDGWFIDDIKLTDLRVTPSLIGPDDLLGTSTCTLPGNPANCGAITLNISGSVAKVLPSDAAGRLLKSDIMGGPVSLDARTSTADICSNGVLQTRWSQLDSNGAVVDVISEFSPQGLAKVAPITDTTYRAEVRCSSDTACIAQRDVQVQVYGGDGTDIGELDVAGNGPTTITWTSRPQPPGTAGYDVFSATATTVPASWLNPATINGTRALGASGVCVQGNIAQVAAPSVGIATTFGTDSRANPAAGQTYMYRVGHSSAFGAAIDPLGVFSGPLVMANVQCP